MASLDAALAELDSILNEVQSSPRLNGADRVKLVIEVRSRIIAQIVLLNNALAGDTQLQASPNLARDFAERLSGLRMKLAALQAKWRVADLTDKFDVYAVESRPVAEGVADFVKWAKAARKAA